MRYNATIKTANKVFFKKSRSYKQIISDLKACEGGLVHVQLSVSKINY